MADTPEPSCALAILVALAKMSADLKATAAMTRNEHLRRGLTMADQILHAHARLYSKGIAPPEAGTGETNAG